jgi:soluble lytic murein transglycosylase-like protein
MQLRTLLLAWWLLAPVCARADTDAAPTADPAELVQLAVRYENAEGVARDYLRAATLYCAAARDGSPDALYGLGWMIANGRGVPVDDAVAGRLFRMAAARGHAHAAELAARLPQANAALPACLTDRRAEAPPVTAAAVADDPQQPARDLRALSGNRIHKLVARLAPKYRVDPNLALAIMYMESGFNAQAKSPKNAQGLMQLIPETAARFNVRNILDPEDNVRGGLAYLRWLLDYFRGDVALAAAAYNAGETTVDRYRGVPPFAETRAYVARLATLYRRNAHPYDEAGATAANKAMAAWRERMARLAHKPAR